MRISRLFFVSTILLAALACVTDNPLSSPDTSAITLSINLPSDTGKSLAKAIAITSITVTVTASDIEEPIVEDLAISSDGKTASGTLKVPRGEDRTFDVVLKDGEGVIRFRGSTTQDIQEKTETVTIVAIGLYSDVTVNVNILAKQLNPSGPTNSLSKIVVVTNVVLSVSASDMETIEAYLTVGSGGVTASGTVDVRKGNNRTFEILCKDANGVVQYSGSTTQDVLAATATVSITTEGHYPTASTLSVDYYDAFSVELSWTRNTDEDFLAYELVRAGTEDDLSSSSTRESIVTITSKTTTTYTDDSVSPDTPYWYAIIVWDTEGMGMRSSPVSVQTPAAEYVQIFSDTGPWPLDDATWTDRYFLNNSFAPSGASVTNVEYRLRIDDAGDDWYFYCADYEIYLSSSFSAGTVTDVLVYDNLGGWTDGGYDDDAEDDSDIYLDWRSTSYFNGEDPNQYWGVYIIDNMSGDSGQLDYLEFRINYLAPSSSPGLITIKVPASTADEGPSLNENHPSVSAQGSIEPVSTGFDKIKSPAGR